MEGTQETTEDVTHKKLHQSTIKDSNKRETLWDKFWAENDMDKAAFKNWFPSQRTIEDHAYEIQSGVPHLTDRQKWY